MRRQHMNWVALGGNRPMARPGFGGICVRRSLRLGGGSFLAFRTMMRATDFAPAGAQWCAGREPGR